MSSAKDYAAQELEAAAIAYERAHTAYAKTFGSDYDSEEASDLRDACDEAEQALTNAAVVFARAKD